MNEDTMNSTEAIFGFIGWLSCRKGMIKIGAKYDCDEIAQLIGEFVEMNNLPKPRDDWSDNLTHPEE